MRKLPPLLGMGRDYSPVSLLIPWYNSRARSRSALVPKIFSPSKRPTGCVLVADALLVAVGIGMKAVGLTGGLRVRHDACFGIARRRPTLTPRLGLAIAA